MGPHETDKLLQCTGHSQKNKMVAYRIGKYHYHPTSDRGIISKIYKELKEVDINIPNIPIKNGVQLETETSQQSNLKCLNDT